MSFSIVHTADLHLDKNFSSLTDNRSYDRKQDLLNSFYSIIDYTLENKPDALLLAGDTFDKVLPRNPAKVKFTSKIREVKENGTKVFIIGGNHDVPKGIKDGAMPIDIMGAAGIAKIFNNSDSKNIESYSLKNESEILNIHGISFNPFLSSSEFITPEVKIQNGYNILMMHGALQGINSTNADFEEDNHIDSASITKSDLDYVAMGHYHNFGQSEYDGTLACYSGSTEKMSFTEEKDAKCFLHLEIDNTGVDFEKIPLKTREMKTLSLDIIDKNDINIDNLIKNKLSKFINPELILRLKLRGKIDLEIYKTLHKTKLYADFVDDYFWFNIIDELKLNIDEIINLDKIEDNPIKLYKTHMKYLIEKSEGKKKVKYQKSLELGLNMLNEIQEDL